MGVLDGHTRARSAWGLQRLVWGSKSLGLGCRLRSKERSCERSEQRCGAGAERLPLYDGPTSPAA